MQTLPDAASRRRSLIIVLTYLSIVFVLAYLTDVGRPGRSIGSSWYQSWYDQHAYYEMVSSIPRGNLGSFRYPPGYPFLGYIGSFLSPWDPFLIIDYALFLGFIVWSWKVFTTFLSGVASLSAALLLTHISARLFVEPWTTSVTAAATALLLYIYVSKRSSMSWGIAAGLAVGLSFSARIGDILILAPILLLCCLDLVAKPRTMVSFALSAFVPLFLIASLTILVDYKLSHTLLGPYVQRVQTQGFKLSSLPRNLYGYFIDCWSLDHYVEVEKTAWRVIPFLLLSPIGLGLLIARQITRGLGMALSLPILAWICAYGPFYSVNGATLAYGSIHYSKMLFPSLLGSAFYFIERASRVRTEMTSHAKSC